ncbi:MAG: hypothetical protein IT495_15550 [Gammaproteobacteria bacterium]|nr:hypothetical protein [Gammaproteobacteria bacterium]
MVTLGTAGLVAAYVLVALLLVSLLLFSRWPWQLKAAMVVVVSTFYIVTYVSIPMLLGWPTDDGLPRRFNLVAVYVQEPDKVTGARGDIYLWVTDMLAPPDQSVPRSYRLPFTPELHAKVVEAGTKLRKNLPQLGEIEEEEGKGSVPLDTTRMGQKSTRIEFYDLPDPLFPEK